jgi:RNA polymerase sigma-54 factor
MLYLKLEAQQGLRQQQRLQLSFAMQQAIQVLQMPALELSDWLKGEIDDNPFLEYEEGFAGGAVSAYEGEFQGMAATPSLFEHLMDQARLIFSTEELPLVEGLIGNLDERGFIQDADISQEQEKILLKLQELDPPGIAARDYRESLMIQLKLKGKEQSLAYTLLKEHFEDLLHNRLVQLAKKISLTPAELRALIANEIAVLNLRPAAAFQMEPNAVIIPDLVLRQEGETWNVELNEETLPKFSVREGSYGNRLMLQRARWLKRAVESRQKTLLGISAYFIKKQGTYLSGESEFLEPLTMHEVGEALSLHVSTIGRAVGRKYLSCPRGTVAMRSLFSYDLGNAVSNHSAKQLLLELIAREDKEHPLSDEALGLKISSEGIPLARRTIAKYRKLLKIPCAHQRRQW